MPETPITFVGTPGLTFVNYGDDRNFKYRREARIHNGHKRVLQTSHKRQMKQQEAISKPGRSTKSKSTSPRLERVSNSPQSTVSVPASVSVPACDPFQHGLASNARALESVWMAAFKENFYLPGASSTSNDQPVPPEFFLSAARLSHHAHENLVLMSKATSQEHHDELDFELLIRKQAESMQEFRNTVDALQKSDYAMSGREFQDIYSAAHALFGLDLGRDAAYNALVYADYGLLWEPQGREAQPVPTAEWIRTLVPRPAEQFRRARAYKASMLEMIGRVLDFVEEAQDNALRAPARAMAPHFAPGTSLHCILAAGAAAAALPAPYPEFDHLCLHRVLFQLHLCLAEGYRREQAQGHDTLRYLEGLAANCLGYEAPAALRLFLWGVLSYTDAQGLRWAERERGFTFAMKHILVGHRISFSQDMLAWLMQEGDGSWHMKLPRVDVDGLRWAMREMYEPLPGEPEV